MTEQADEQVMLALTTEANRSTAEALARTLLERRLAACIALQPQHALYWWDGEVQSTEEVQLLIKCSGATVDALREAVHALHSYDTPEWLVWSADSSVSYGTWIRGLPLPDAAAPAP
jgi:periplasmic divalent cation tolerance protein